MAGIGMTIFGAVINAFSFAGGSKLFSMFDKDSYASEMKRRDLAQEKLTRDRDEWEEHRQQVIDFANLQMKREQEVGRTFREANESLEDYNEIWNELHPTNKIQLDEEPQLDYQPSQEMKNYEYLAIVIGVVGTGLVIWYFY